MISEDSLQKISHLFCGDTGEKFAYKSGPKLVSFFNTYFLANDKYESGFPSRWIYVYNKLVGFLNGGVIQKFLDIILSKEYLMSEQNLTAVDAASRSQDILNELNNIIKKDQYAITKSNGHYNLVSENTDLVLIGSGGFANVYRQKSTGLIKKRLKDDFITDKGIRSRFKREFAITKKLAGFGVIEVYNFDENDCSYTMEPAEMTLETYVKVNALTEESKVICIRQILYIMSDVHKKDIIHRDLSPNNIFIISGRLKIADFGLGIDLNVFTSHQTLHTKEGGQYLYCAPEQFMMLRDADKRSDVYSLGRIINFIMTGNPSDSHHAFRNVTEKATSSDAVYRYADATQLLAFFEKALQYQKDVNTKKHAEEKMRAGVYDEEVENYLSMLSDMEISKNIYEETNGFDRALLAYMHVSEDNAQHIIQSIDKSYRDVCGRVFQAYDPFAQFSATVIGATFSYLVKEIAANILRFIAWDVNRYCAQRMVDGLISSGIEPILEEMISQ